MVEREDSEVLQANLSANDDRRRFLAICGKLAVTVPPAMTMLLSTSLSAQSIALSSGEKLNCNKGGGNGSEGCDPGNNPDLGNDDETP